MKKRSKIRIRFSFYKALRTEGLTVKQAWKAAGEAMKYAGAMTQAMKNLPSYDITRLYHKPKDK